MNKLRVLLAEDQTILRESLRLLISSEPDMEVVGEAADGDEAVELAGTLRPDAVVMDISMPRRDGIEATLAIRRARPECKVLVLSVHETRSSIRRALQAGVSGYVAKRSAADELIQGLRAMSAEGVYLDPIVAAKIVSGPHPSDAVPPSDERLSPREADILRLIADGYSNKEIAARLNLSVKSIETFKTRAMEKLGLRGRVDIVRYAVDRGWLRGSGEESGQ